MPPTSPPASGPLSPPLPRTMRAVVITGHGGLDVIEAREVPVPRPGPGEVLVRVHAAGCNNTDLWTREGSYGAAADPDIRTGWLGPLDFPRIQGADVAGTVVASGDGTAAGRIGARVLVDPAEYDGPGPDARPADVLGSERDGGFAEYVVVPSARAHSVDGSPLTDIELAALPIAYGTALGMLDRGSVSEGHTVLVTGASGGVGLAAVQLARARGARVVAVCSGEKGEAVRSAGADAVVDRRRGQVLADAAKAAPEGYDAVVDVVAGAAVGPGLGLLRAGGRWVVAGALDGWAVEIDVRRLYLADLALVGSTMHTPRIFDRLVEIARHGDVRPVVAATYPLGEVREAQEQLARRRHVGKLIVIP
ncbi:zinc-binding dehydrogenase [Streptomyces meridianus]|uniref:Zinc-binding dehydrogenase n=1 Tax=Streptomyces meridianus TaxID=2938945 RepID=A0ABT0X113_9ACTN|nr:zinc-binding dehydrogenase [Streptomyces meridianus]MCM2576251.1 zinc-binding dehydrogenase [Streptomyces meridianus]